MRVKDRDWDRGASPGQDDETLMRAVAGGCRSSFRQLMERHLRAMLALATRVTGNPHDADEIVQDCFMKLWAQADKWRPDGPAGFSTWLYRVVMNAALDRRRRVTFQPLEDAGEPEDTTPSGVDRTLARQRDALVSQALDHIPARQARALALYYFSELSAPQAARVLELSVPALEALLVRGKRSLGDYLRRRGFTSLEDLA